MLHALLTYPEAPSELLVRRSDGALQIGNAIRSLAPERTHALRVGTLGSRDAPIPLEMRDRKFEKHPGTPVDRKMENYLAAALRPSGMLCFHKNPDRADLRTGERSTPHADSSSMVYFCRNAVCKDVVSGAFWLFTAASRVGRLV